MYSEQEPNGYNIDSKLGSTPSMRHAVNQLARIVGQQGLRYVNNLTADILDDPIDEFVDCLGLKSGLQRRVASLGLKIRFLPEDKQKQEIIKLESLMQGYRQQQELPLLYQFTKDVGDILTRFNNPAQFDTFYDMVTFHIGGLQNQLQAAQVTATDHTSFSSN